MTPQDMQALGERVLAAQPFSRFLGARLDRFVEGEAQLSLALRPEFLQQHGRPHGGILSYLADNALTFAGGSLYGDGLTLEDMTLEAWRHTMSVNLDGVFLGVKHGIRAMKSRGGSIINTSSILGFVGMKPVHRTCFGMVEHVGDARRRKWLSEVQEMGRNAA